MTSDCYVNFVNSQCGKRKTTYLSKHVSVWLPWRHQFQPVHHLHQNLNRYTEKSILHQDVIIHKCCKWNWSSFSYRACPYLQITINFVLHHLVHNLVDLHWKHANEVFICKLLLANVQSLLYRCNYWVIFNVPCYFFPLDHSSIHRYCSSLFFIFWIVRNFITY